MAFAWTAKQEEARSLMAGPAMHILLYGGSRSGKTFLIVRTMLMRALKAPHSRHLIARFRFNHVKASIGQDTLQKVNRECFPKVKIDLNREDWVARLPNGSEIWLGGLDEKERVEKVLGNEYATVFLNEVSQIPFESRNIALTRLAQKVDQVIDGQHRPLPLRMYYDENPPSQGHWSYKLFIRGLDPESGQRLKDQANYASMRLNPHDNEANLPAAYLSTLEAMPGRLRRRFLEGEFAEATPNALFPDEVLDRWRVIGGELPEMQRIVIGVDPSGARGADAIEADPIGIIVAGLGQDGNAYVLEDLTLLAGPAVWGNVVGTAFDRHMADRVIGEVNYGGAMVEHVIKTARAGTPFRMVTASRGKAVRAEPVSALMEQGKVRLVGYLRDLESELAGFSTMGYLGERSPNRADAFVWAISELFPALTRAPRKPEQKPEPRRFVNPNAGPAWMGV